MAQISIEELYRDEGNGEKYGILGQVMKDFPTNGHPEECDERNWIEMFLVKHTLITAEKMKKEGEFVSGITDIESLSCYPSYRSIGNAIGKSRNTVRKYVAGLEAKRLIYTEPTEIISKDGHKLNGNLCYTICPIEEAIQYSFDRQMQKAEQENAKQRALKRLEKYDQASKRKVV